MTKKKNKICPDCGKLIWNVSERCKVCANIGACNPMFGKSPSPETRKRISESVKGGKNGFFGKKHTEETKERWKGRCPWNKEKKLHEEHKRKISEGNKGKKISEEAKIKMSLAKQGLYEGKNNPNWRGGLRNLPYSPDWGPKVKRKVLERDGHECQNCKEIENLSVHHIDYCKMNCDSTNLITLCVSCNSKANYDRDYWQRLYEEKINGQK